MDHEARHERLELFKRLSREKGERCTVQRLVILEAVLDLEDHPSADRVFEAVRTSLPGISKPTVYRTLDHLARLGVITKACHPGSVTRFEARTDIHHHLVCMSCDQLVDFEAAPLDRLEIPDTSEIGFEVADYRVQLRGICRSCRASQRKEESR